jgi:para-nitrobenzyl esterase
MFIHPRAPNRPAANMAVIAVTMVVSSCAMTASSTASAPQTPELSGTSWQLAAYQGPAGATTLTAEDRAKYTVEFAGEGQLRTRVDCNRGRGTWQAGTGGKLQLGSLALTRARCPEGSLHDQIVKHWTAITSYAVKNGRLFLIVTGDGGTYELEPAPKSP